MPTRTVCPGIAEELGMLENVAARSAVGPGLIVIVCDPVIVLVPVSVAVSVCAPAVFAMAAKACEPASPAVNV